MLMGKRKSWPPSGRAERPISKHYRAIDTDLARDNLENDLPDADRQDL